MQILRLIYSDLIHIDYTSSCGSLLYWTQQIPLPSNCPFLLMRIIINSLINGNIFSCFLCLYYWNDLMISFKFKFNVYQSSQKALHSVLPGDINTCSQFTNVNGNCLSLASSINMKQTLKVLGSLTGSTYSSKYIFKWIWLEIYGKYYIVSWVFCSLQHCTPT